MRRFAITFLLASLAAPAMAQAPQMPLKQQLDGASAQIDRIVESMAMLIMQQDAQIKQLQAAVEAAKPPTPPSPILPPAPK